MNSAGTLALSHPVGTWPDCSTPSLSTPEASIVCNYRDTTVDYITSWLGYLSQS